MKRNALLLITDFERTQVTDRNGRISEYIYDDLNRRTHEHNNAGNVATATDPLGYTTPPEHGCRQAWIPQHR